MRLRLLAIAALLLIPGASAGTERAPEITDPQDRADWSPTDLLAAWFEAEEEGVRFHVKTLDGSMPERFPDHVYWVSFRVDGRDVGATVGFGNDGILRGHLGPLNGPAWNRGGFERVANGGVIGLEEERGRPSVWSGVVPWGAVPALEEGAELTQLTAGTGFYDRDARQWRGGLDVATTERTFVADPTSSFFPVLVPAWMLPTIVLACTLVGLAAGALLARVAARPAPVPVPVSVPVRAAPPPPGARFQRSPSAKR